jgi:kynurenine formamidase
MKIFDLTHTINNGMPAWPGEESPSVEKKYTHAREGFQVIKLQMLTHSGTHLDTPVHFFDNNQTTNVLPLENFYGKGLVIDCRNFGKHQEISGSHFDSHKEELKKSDFVLIWTGWDRFWGSDEYFDHFPVLSFVAAKVLASYNIKGVGLDVGSIDKIDSKDYPNHNLILGNNIIIIENLTGLFQLENKPFYFSAFPLKIHEGDGSPVRAAGIVI